MKKKTSLKTGELFALTGVRAKRGSKCVLRQMVGGKGYNQAKNEKEREKHFITRPLE